MRRPPALTLLLAAGLLAHSGCVFVDGMRDGGRKMVSAFKLQEDDAGARTNDPWVHQAGVEARGDRPREKAVDPAWLRKLTMSEEHRDIERQLGIDEEWR